MTKWILSLTASVILLRSFAAVTLVSGEALTCSRRVTHYYCSLNYAFSTEETIRQDFLLILKHWFQNY